MKTLFALILGLCISFAASAQVLTMTHNGDTVVNAATKNLDLTLSGSFANVAIQVVVLKISGTVAGTVTLQASLDGTTFINIGADVLTNSNQTTNTHFWNVAPSPYLYYRLACVGSGTMSASVRGYVLGRK